jgi:hypothetical protein
MPTPNDELFGQVGQDKPVTDPREAYEKKHGQYADKGFEVDIAPAPDTSPMPIGPLTGKR